jgi:hypothetical protein
MKRFARSVAVLLILGLAGCGGGGSSYGASGTSTTSGISYVSTSLVDAPFQTTGGTVTAVNIAVAKVELIGSGGIQTLVTFSPSQQINLLNYQATALQLGTGQIPAGTYQQLRFVLDTSQASNTSVVINGATYDLSIPSATGIGFGGNSSTDTGDGVGTSGIKVNVSFTARAGQTYGFLIDFNAAESIVSTGGGNYLMKPVLVATAQSVSGTISGTVKNNAGGAVSGAEVVAMQGGTAINSGVTDTSGNFTINALPAGSYTLVVNNTWTSQAGASETATGYDLAVGASLTVSGSVTVTAGQSTSAGTITD